MDKIDLLSKFNAIVCDILGNDNVTLSDESQAYDVEGWDSLANITILTVFESEIGIKFEVAELVSFQNVGAIIDAAAKHLD